MKMPRFKIKWDRDTWSLGITLIPDFPHKLSFYINLIKIEVYIGLGKAHDGHLILD